LPTGSGKAGHVTKNRVETQVKVQFQLKTPYRDGTTHFFFGPLDFIARLAALVPKPRVNLTRFHGVFAPNSYLRAQVVPGRRNGHKAKAPDPAPAERRASMTWAQCFEMLQECVLDRLTRLLWRRSANLTPHNQWSGAKHWPQWPSLTTKAREASGGCQQSTNWNRWWFAPPTVRPCRPGILSPTCRTFTGHLPPACTSPIGPGPCTWEKARGRRTKVVRTISGMGHQILK